MRINNNVMALNAHRQLGINQTNSSKSMERLSSGMRINRAGDDAAGLAISEKMRGQIRGLKQASRNAQDGISLIQTAEGALNETHSILQRMRELANQASTDTNTLTDRKEIQKEINQLLDEIDRIAEQTEFNTQTLLDGTYSDKKLHIGANSGQNMDINIGNLGAAAIGSLGEVGEVEDGEGEGAVGEVTVEAGGENADTVTAVAISSSSDYEGVYTVTIGSSGAVTITDEDSNEIASGTVSANTEVTIGDFTFTVNDITENNTFTFTVTQPAEGDAGDKTNIDALKVDAADIDGLDAKLTDEEVVTALGEGKTGVLTQAGADKAITNINDAIEQVSAERSKLGAIQNRLEHTIANLGTSAENLQAAESRIRDLDMADEIMAFTKNNILQQAATAMLAQANMAPQSVLQLLG